MEKVFCLLGKIWR